MLNISDILENDPYTSEGSVSYWYPTFYSEFCSNETFIEECKDGLLDLPGGPLLDWKCECTTGEVKRLAKRWSKLVCDRKLFLFLF